MGRRLTALAAVGALFLGACAVAQEPAARLALPVAPGPEEPARGHPITLAAALELAGTRPIDVHVAAERVRIAYAQLTRARAAWLPTIYLGADYARQDGRVQDIGGRVFSTNRTSLMVGVGPSAVFAPADAVLAPLAARQSVAAREAGRQAAVNDSTLAVAETYFNVQQARGELAGAVEAARTAEDLANRAEKLVGLVQPVEATRAKAELARRQQAVQSARERWESASADLNRLLRLPPAAILEPAEPPDLQVDLFDPAESVDNLIPVALTARPELAAQQALVQATLARLKQEKLRPLIPSVVLRGNATNPAGTLSTGLFGGGIEGRVANAGMRNAFDVQVLWEVQNLGFGNRAAVQEREAENKIALLDLFRVQDRVAAEVVQAHAALTRSAARTKLAETGLKAASETVKTHLEGLAQTRRVGDTQILVFRPQEAVAAVQALDQAYRDYFGAVADANRAAFRLYRAVGRAPEDLRANCEPTGEGSFASERR